MMNPILDITAKVASPEAQAPAAAPTKGDGQNLFTQVFAQAVAATEPVATPAVAVEAFANIVGPDKPAEENFAAQLANAVCGPALAAIGMPVISGSATVETGVMPMQVAADETVVNLDSNKTNDSGKGATQVAVPNAESRIAIGQLPQQQVDVFGVNAGQALNEQAQTLIEEALAGDTKQESSPVTIPTQVQISDEALVAISKPEVAPTTGETNLDNSPIQPNAKPVTVSLKAQMRKSFGAAEIKSASAKAAVEVKLTDAQIKNSTPIETGAATPVNVNAVELPMASARQIAMATVNPTMVKKSIRSERTVSTNGKRESEFSSRQVAEDKIATRVAARPTMRKPVQIALKSQGFDLDKLAASTARGESAISGANQETTDALTSLDKPAAVAFDRTHELNGIERFKLEIKRGHIEALLKKGEVKLQLQPDHLGSLKIKLLTNPTNVSARMETSSEEARRAVEASLPQLRESFERAGLKLGSIEVVVSHDNEQKRQQAFHQDTPGRNARRALREFGGDIPVTLTEIANTPLSAYGGALNLVA